MNRLYECVPQDPVIRSSNWYCDKNDPWLYIYRYFGASAKLEKMLSCAGDMVKQGYKYSYINPGFGPEDWCCVTVTSYWIYEAGMVQDKEWIMGSSNQSYIWSPKYGGAYDALLLNNGWKKYLYNESWLINKKFRAGDIIQSAGHIAVIAADDHEIFEVEKMPTLMNGDTGNVVKNLQALLNLWTTQSGKYKAIKIDGIFGDETEERLKLYQELQGLNVTGYCDAETWKDILLA